MKIGVLWAVAILFIGTVQFERLSNAQVESGQLAGARNGPIGRCDSRCDRYDHKSWHKRRAH